MSYMGVVRPTIALTSSDIADDAVITAKINDDAVTAAKIANSINTDISANTAKVTNATHTGDVTGATALTIATDAVDIAMLSATGTASATTFLRGDNAWAAVATSSNTPAFSVKLNSAQTVATATVTIINWDTEILDSDGDFDTTVNVGRFTPTTAGYYYFSHSVLVYPLQVADKDWRTAIRKNGTLQQESYNITATTYGQYTSGTVGYVLHANGSSDYFDTTLYQNSGSDKTVSGNFRGFLLAGA
jgi:hypothetical protein